MEAQEIIARRIARELKPGMLVNLGIGIPTIVCGPGDIAQAHQPEEWVAEADIAACLDYLSRLTESLVT